jgi:hypothetical protein
VLRLWRAARAARSFVTSARTKDGTYALAGWRPVDRQTRRGNAAPTVYRLRVIQRLSMGFLDPVEDAIFLTEGLRRMGFDASFHIGRELVPMRAPGGFFAWVTCHDDVVSTSIPVREEYVEIHRSVGR